MHSAKECKILTQSFDWSTHRFGVALCLISCYIFKDVSIITKPFSGALFKVLSILLALTSRSEGSRKRGFYEVMRIRVICMENMRRHRLCFYQLWYHYVSRYCSMLLYNFFTTHHHWKSALYASLPLRWEVWWFFFHPLLHSQLTRELLGSRARKCSCFPVSSSFYSRFFASHRLAQ